MSASSPPKDEKKPSSSTKIFGFHHDQMPLNSVLPRNYNYHSKIKTTRHCGYIIKFKCDYCSQEFPSPQALGGHLNKHKTQRMLAKLQFQLQFQAQNPPPPLFPHNLPHYFDMADGEAGSITVSPPLTSGGGGYLAAGQASASNRSDYNNAYEVNEGDDIDLQLRLAPGGTFE